MGHFNDAATRAAGLLLTSSLLVAGCSSSSDSGALTEDANVVSDIDSIATTAQPEADPVSSGASNEVIVSANDPVEEAVEPVDPASEFIPADTIVNEQNSEPTMEVVPDPLVQNITQVDFGITVPAYQSDALQVRLTWGDTDVTAGWVGDELWSTSLELPTNTENTLSVTFSDRNGGTELASFEQTYRTGSNAAEVYEIVAEQFDSDQWDTDNDGTSNLDELIAGSDPLSNEALRLEVRESYLVTPVRLVSAYHEQSISSERPFSFSLEELPPTDAGFDEVRRTHTISIEIDASGNGIFSDNFEFRDTNDSDITTEDQAATRVRTENSVLWAGTYRRGNSSSQVFEDIDFSIETQSIDDQTSKQDGSVQRTLRGRGSLDFEQDLSYSLIGEALDDSQNCTPSSGTLTNSITNTRSFPVSGDITVASKESDETLWSVRVTNLEGEFIDEYLAQSLIADFYCDFTDL